jgi:hypothetical protein
MDFSQVSLGISGRFKARFGMAGTFPFGLLLTGQMENAKSLLGRTKDSA